MLLVKLNGVDITDKVDYNTVKITEQMNNRSNTCSFTVSNYMVPEGALIEIWEGSEITSDVGSGVSTIPVDDTFEYFQKYRVGDTLRIPAGSSGAIKRVIQSVDHTAKTVTFTATLGTAYIKGTKVGRLIFAGVTMKNPDQEIGCSGVFVFNVTTTDYTKLFDAKNVVDTFEDQYPREVIGRVVHKFTAPSSFLEISDAETTTGWSVPSGVGLAPGTSTTDRAYKNASVTGGASGAGTLIYRFTPGAAANISSYSHLRAWLKIDAGNLAKLTAPKFRAVTSIGNYLEWSDMVQCEDCWSYDSFEIADGVATGTPNLASIAYYEYQWTVSTSIPLGGILFDQISATTGSFTIKNVMRGTTQYGDIRAQYKKPTILLEDLAKLQKLYWYIDYERDIHFFEQESYTCPMEILDTSEVYGDLSITADISQLKNRQVVRGGEAIDASTYTQDEVTDGKLESWRLDYKPKGLKIYVDTTGTGTSYVEKTVGVENLDSAASFDYLYNFNEKIVKRASAPLLAAGTLFRRVYYPYKPIRVQVEDSTSVTAMKALLGGDGIFDGALITDLSIRSFQDARDRARAEIAPYKNPVITATWNSDQDGWRAGQIVHIQDTNRGIDSSFVIQKVTRSQKTSGRWSYQVQAGSTMFGLIEFFQLLLRRSENLLIDVSEIVDIVKTIDEVVTIGESWTLTKKERPFFATPLNPAETLRTNESAWYEFDGNGNDSTGHGYTATPVGPVTFGEDAGGKYVQFNGDYNYATGLGTAAYLNIGAVMLYDQNKDYSWSVTFSITTLPANQGSGIFGSGFDNSIYLTSAGTMSISLRGATNVFIGVGSSGYWASRLGQTHTVSFSYDGTTKKAYAYLDGVLQNIGGTTGPATFLCNEWKMGDFAIGGGNMTSCIKKIYSVRVYDKKMTDIEALWIARNPVFDITDYFSRNTHMVGNLKFGGGSISAINGADQFVTDYYGDKYSAFSFDGNDLITQNAIFTGMGQEFTMHAMIYPTTITGSARRILMSTNDRLGIHIDASGYLVGYVYDTTYRSIGSPSTLSINTWYHVGLTYKTNSLKLYINGTLVQTLAVTGPIVAATDGYIGNWSSLAQGFIGKIDEWEFSTTARDDPGMLELYKRCTIGNDAYADYCEAS